MKQLVTTIVAFGLLATSFVPGIASAQSTSLEAQLKIIQDLTAQINALQAQINGLKQQQSSASLSAKQATLEILANLSQGSQGDQVKVLQTLLALDAAIYPEGQVTGYYGPATRRAVIRFQRKYGLEGVGVVGPKTRSELNKIIKDQFKEVSEIRDDVREEIAEALEDAFEGSGFSLPVIPYDPANPCKIPSVPFGSSTPFLIAGKKVKIVGNGNVFIYHDGKNKIIITPNSYIAKNGNRKVLITPGVRLDQTNSGGTTVINCGGNATTTPPSGNDTTAPIISAISSSVTHTGATIYWITNEAATGKVYYGTTSPLKIASSTMMANSFLQTGHTFNLSGLSASTTYYYVVESADKKGNTATSSQQSFKTTDTPDTTAPSISAVSVTNVGTSTATITWTTNENSNSKVYYSLSSPINTGTASTKIDSSLVTSHSVILTGLTPNSAHYFKVESTDGSGNANISTEGSFTTSALPADTTAPNISGLSVTPSSTTASVIWTTNEAATSKIYFSLTTPINLGTALTVTDNALVTSHNGSLTGLTASTTYYYVVESKDAANNTATTSEAMFNTTSS